MNIVNFKHSGNAGDIIYALPSIKAFCESNNMKAEVYLKVGQPSGFTKEQHPVGNVMLDLKMASMLQPLIEAQRYVKKVVIIGQGVQDCTLKRGGEFFDLDLFRKDYKNLSAGNIAQWIGNSFPELRPNLYEPSIKFYKFDIPKTDYIIVNRSNRYQNLFFDYSILKDYENVYFVRVTSVIMAFDISSRFY